MIPIASIFLTGLTMASRPVDLIDPMIGVDGGGNVFPGPSMPYGMVKLGPDCGDLNPNAGYSGDEIHGFSHTHVSGTGGGPKYGNVLVTPWVGTIDPAHHTSARDKELATVGLYQCHLLKGDIGVQLAVTRRTGAHVYTFPASSESHILFDLGSVLGVNAFPGEKQSVEGGEVRIISPTELEGYTRVRGGWNIGGAYTVYFYAKVDTKAKAWGTWRNGELHPGNREEADGAPKVGAYFTYSTQKNQSIEVRVGISFVGLLKAKQNYLRESKKVTFDQLILHSRDEWNEAVSKVSVQGGTQDQQKCLYTGIYHTMLMPVDRTGENPKWHSTEPYYDDFYAIWDTFRTSNPLLTLIAPNRQRDIVRSLIDIYEHDGYMPDARSGNDNGRTQGGSNCDILVGDAFVKGLSGIDYEKGFAAMVKNAEVPPGGTNEEKEGRGGLYDYNRIGYVSLDYTRGGTRTVEYANCDWSLAQVAHGLGKKDEAQKYLKRASNWKNLWAPIEDRGFTGFIWPRHSDGSWLKGNFTTLTGGSWHDPFYETNSWEYSLYVPQDVAGLIAKCGGRDLFLRRLDTYFANNFYQVENEPSFLAPYLYIYAGKPEKTAHQVQKTMAERYKATREGLPGNDDSGAMSSWYVFSALGFFPNAGQDLYLMSCPVFDRAVIDLGNGEKFEIEAQGRGSYIASATLNGKPLDRAWFRHSEISQGARLVITRSLLPTQWGTQTLPPSMDDIVAGW